VDLVDGNPHQTDHGTTELLAHLEHALEYRVSRVDQIVPQQDREGLIADVALRHQHRVPESQGITLTHVVDACEVGGLSHQGKPLEVREEFGGSVICLMRVPIDQIHLYGCPAVEITDGSDVVVVTDLVEKPEQQSAPSDFAVIGRYVLDPAVFAVLKETQPGRGGEIQLTDALRILATMPSEEGGGVRGVVFEGRRYDTGDRLSYLKAVIRLACERDDLGPDLKDWLATFVAE
jgi:UTP-glucose-1-phosphate uridylyltransferase